MIIEELRQDVKRRFNSIRSLAIIIGISVFVAAIAVFSMSVFWNYLELGGRFIFFMFCAMGSLIGIVCSIGMAAIMAFHRADKKRLGRWQRIVCSEDEKIKSAYNELLELEEKISTLRLLEKEYDAKVFYIDSLAK
jgi:hypothetical protein